MISRLWINVDAVVNDDLEVIEDFVNKLNNVYTSEVGFLIDVISTQLTSAIEALDNVISIASIVNATGQIPSNEQLNLANLLKVSRHLCINTAEIVSSASSCSIDINHKTSNS